MTGSTLLRVVRGALVRPSARAFTVGGVAIGVLAPICLRGAWEGHSLVAFTALLVAVSYVVCGAWLVESPLSATSGWWAVGVGVLWVLNNAGVGQAGAWPFVNWCVSAVVWVPVALIISSYPRGVPWSREHRWWLLVAVAYLGPGCTALTLFARPEWSGFSADAWWPTAGTSRALFEATSAAAGVAYVLLSLWFVRIIRRRLQGLSAIDRAVLRPALWGSAGAALLASTASLVQNLVLTSDAWATSVAVQGLGLLALPAVVAFSAHRAITTRERVADLVLQLGAPSHDAVRSLLRSCLGDDSLDILYRGHDPERFVDHDGAPVDGPAADRLVVPVRGGRGDVIAVVSADPRLRQHEALVDATVLAAGFVLANVRLQADLRSRVTEAEVARALVVDSQRTERERVADDLHDGLQQALLGLRARARAVQALTERDDMAQEAGRVADHAQEVLQRVRLVSRGLSSPLLRSEGLDVALEEVTDQLAAAGLVVDLDVQGAPVGERVKDVAYMWISEALACVSEAGASLASVSVLCRAQEVSIDVRDDAARDAAWPDEAVRALTRRAQMVDGEVFLDRAPKGERAPRVSVVLPDPQPAGA